MKIPLLVAAGMLAFLLCLMATARSSHSATALSETDTGAQLYSKNCARCHGKDGQAGGFKAKVMHARNLTDAEWQDRVSDERLFNSINNGKGKMPAFGKKLAEADINSLVNYVRSLKK